MRSSEHVERLVEGCSVQCELPARECDTWPASALLLVVRHRMTTGYVPTSVMVDLEAVSVWFALRAAQCCAALLTAAAGQSRFHHSATYCSAAVD